MKSFVTSEFAGVTTLLFAACPTVELGLMAFSDFIRGGGDHMPVGVGVPPLEFAMVVALVLSSPWIAAGVLLLRREATGRWLALVLTIPSILLVFLFGAGALHGFCWVWIIEHNWEGLLAGFVFGPFALIGLVFCLVVWWFQFSYRKSQKTN